MRRFVVRVFVLASACLMCLAICRADEFAAVTGLVTDPHGGSVPGVAVVITNLSTNITSRAVTNDQGIYRLPSLQPGIYRMTLDKDGFKSIVKSGVELHVQDVASINFELQIGSVNETVTVEAGGLIINTTDATVSTVVDRQFVKELPLNGRSFQTLFQLTPGVVIASTNAAEPGQFNINGQRANANYFTVDGVSANITAPVSSQPGQLAGGSLPALTQAGGTNALVSVDALQEFSIQTSTYAPEYGRTPGGQISIVTRSGTNDFHGDVFDYFRNDLLDANDWFANSLGLKKAALRQNDFGGVFGGPVMKDKTFFFFSYEGLRLLQPITRISDVPSLATRQAAPRSIQPYVNAFPLPTGPDEGNGLAPADYSFSDPSRIDAESLRIDRKIGKNVMVFGRYNRSTSDAATRGGFISVSDVSHDATKLHTATVGLTWALRPNVSNEFHFNWSWSGGSHFFVDDALGGGVPLVLSSIVPVGQDPANSNFFLSIDSGNNSLLNAGPFSQGTQKQVNLIDTWSWQTRSHQLKFGIDYRRLTPRVNVVHYSQEVTFPTVSDLLAGQPGSAQITTNFMPVVATYNNYSLFAQDTWKIRPRLTITYGLRWDYNPAPSAHGPNGLPLLTIVGISDLANLAPAPPGTPLYHATLDNFAPRLGIAYHLRDSSTHGAVVRTGFGVFYDLGNGSSGNSLIGFPFSQQSFPAATVFPLTASDAAAAQPSLNPPYGFMVAYPKTLRQPYTYHWNLSLEQAIGSSQALTMSYVGAVGHSLIRQDVFQGGNLSPNFANIFYVNNLGRSNYNAFQAQFRRRQTNRLDILASYTWAHSLDNVSKDSDIVSPLASGIVDSRANYGPSDYDIRHTGSLAVDYQFPLVSGRAWAKALLNGWAMNTLLVARSAPPVSVVIVRDIGAGPTGYRPDVVPNVPFYLHGPQYPGGTALNPAAFSVAAEPRQGDLGRNALRGFPLVQQDFSVRRSFHIRESLQLQARLEAFNVFNHPNFASPQGFLGSFFGSFVPASGFGVSQAMFGVDAANGIGTGSGFNPLYQVGGPRSLQVALKLEF